MPAYRNLAILAALLLAAAFVAACAGGLVKPLPERHPEKLSGNAVCSSCHTKGEGVAFAAYDHRGGWMETHRLRAKQGEKVCSMCHTPAYCADCHGQPAEMTPAVRRQVETQRDLPHRGDYLSRHRIDARLDPTSCLRCHGNPRASKNCSPCHGK